MGNLVQAWRATSLDCSENDVSKEKKKSDGLPDVSEHIEKRNALLTEFGEN